MTYLQRPYEDLLLVCQSIIVHVEKKVSQLPIIFDDNLKVTSVEFFIADFNLFICEADNFTFIVLY